MPKQLSKQEASSNWYDRIEAKIASSRDVNYSDISYHLQRINEIIAHTGYRADLVLAKVVKVHSSKSIKWALVGDANRTKAIPLAYRILLANNTVWTTTLLDGYTYYTFDANNKRFYCDKDKRLVFVYSLLPGYQVASDGKLSEMIYKSNRKIFDVRD